MVKDNGQENPILSSMADIIVYRGRHKVFISINLSPFSHIKGSAIVCSTT